MLLPSKIETMGAKSLGAFVMGVPVNNITR